MPDLAVHINFVALGHVNDISAGIGNAHVALYQANYNLVSLALLHSLVASYTVLCWAFKLCPPGTEYWRPSVRPMLTNAATTLAGSTTLPHHVWSYTLMLSPEMGASY